MPKYRVTVVKTIITEIEVIAASAIDARRHVEGYGVIEAASDMAKNDSVVAKIKSVKLLSLSSHE